MHPLDKFIAEHTLYSQNGAYFVKPKDMAQLKTEGYSAESFLDYFCKRYNCLLHGSRVDIPEPFLRSIGGKIFCTNSAAIALVSAILSNRGLTGNGLEYDWIVDENHPLEVKVHGLNEETIGENGFVYVVKNIDGFRNCPEDSWQYITESSKVAFCAKIPVEKSDFRYPVIDASTGKKVLN